MRLVRLLIVLGAILSAGLVVGSAIAPLPYTENDECLRPSAAYVAPGAEGASYRASLDLWPLRVRCEYDMGGGQTRLLVIGPGVAETLGWSAVFALLIAAALRRRRSALLRGVVLASCFLAPVVVALLYSEFVLALWVAVGIGAPFVVAVDYALRVPGERRWARSLLTGCAVSPIVFFACFVFHFAGYSRAGITAGLVAGALCAALVPHMCVRAMQTSTARP